MLQKTQPIETKMMLKQIVPYFSSSFAGDAAVVCFFIVLHDAYIRSHHFHHRQIRLLRFFSRFCVCTVHVSLCVWMLMFDVQQYFSLPYIFDCLFNFHFS